MDFLKLPYPISDNYVHQTWEMGLKLYDTIDNGTIQLQLIYVGGILVLWRLNPKNFDGINEELIINIDLRNDVWFKII